MVSYINGGMQAKDIRKQHPEAKIWFQEEWECRRLYNKELHSLYLHLK
jgi:hypothetical protein